MPKISLVQHYLDEICLQFCDHVEECPIGAECYYRMQVREIIENICDDDSNNGVDEA